MAYTRVKICGITRPEDARAAADAGADAIGMVFYPGSARRVTVEGALPIAAAVGPLVTTVALFVNPGVELVRDVLARVRPALLQFHGDEDNAFCAQFGHPFIKAIRVRPDTDPAAAMAPFDGASGFLFDAWSADAYGGTGKTFDWGKLGGLGGFPLILAGGLDPGNVGEAVRRVRPYAVDVSGGVESAPGIKDPDSIARFVAAARAAGA
ncbi:MAG: phosphoribosylanthranilate isomerase [Porticoccaceae bacterium]|jgi:phosphoribosylanthranilate isomerase|nr:phosphoribosylanthranilate isomerase [Porticoccaceae bacterium]MEA3300038.1 phosphoribosylanthranilate isomerase [Pseudomonadota bacterium]